MRQDPDHRITVMIADDHAVVRQGLRLILDGEDDIEVVAEAEDRAGAVRGARGHAPNVLLLDLTFRDGSSTEILPRVIEEAPATRVLVLTMDNDPAVARQTLRAGARGFVLKDAAGTELVRAIRAVAAGSVYVQPEMGGMIAALDNAEPNLLDEISEREVEVLRLLALGHTNREIADQLILSVRTVETHRAHLHSKLSCNSRAELVRYAIDHGLLAH